MQGIILDLRLSLRIACGVRFLLPPFVFTKALAAVLAASLLAGGCVMGGAAVTAPPGAGRVIRVVAAENFWGSIASQLGGLHVQVTSIVTNPNADPHSYDPTTADARSIAAAQMIVVNGLGYDSWVTRLLAADSGKRTVLTVGRLLHLPDGSNPHRWYDPADVQAVVGAIVSDYSKLDPTDSSYFQGQRTQFESNGLSRYHSLIAEIRARFAGTPVGASESIFSMLAPALGLDLVTPPSFLRAVSEGADVSAADKAAIDSQIRHHRIAIYVYNSQNTTPDVQDQLQECRAVGIPTAVTTETLVPASASYQDWQARQLDGILGALERGAAA